MSTFLRTRREYRLHHLLRQINLRIHSSVKYISESYGKTQSFLFLFFCFAKAISVYIGRRRYTVGRGVVRALLRNHGFRRLLHHLHLYIYISQIENKCDPTNMRALEIVREYQSCMGSQRLRALRHGSARARSCCAPHGRRS